MEKQKITLGWVKALMDLRFQNVDLIGHFEKGGNVLSSMVLVSKGLLHSEVVDKALERYGTSSFELMNENDWKEEKNLSKKELQRELRCTPLEINGWRLNEIAAEILKDPNHDRRINSYRIEGGIMKFNIDNGGEKSHGSMHIDKNGAVQLIICLENSEMDIAMAKEFGTAFGELLMAHDIKSNIQGCFIE